MLQCARCHGEEGQGSSFGPSLLVALKPDGHVPSREEFLSILTKGREDKGCPRPARWGLIRSTWMDCTTISKDEAMAVFMVAVLLVERANGGGEYS